VMGVPDGMPMRFEADLAAILFHDPVRLNALRLVRSLALPDCWIGAGVIRDAVWDHLHGRVPTRPGGDVDIVWFDPARAQASVDQDIEREIGAINPNFAWSVKNQARMHLRNGDAPYESVADAMRSWPETATAVAVRLSEDDRIEVNAPLGLDDLFALRLTPTPAFAIRKRGIFEQRVAEKGWLSRYPLLQRISV